MSLDLSVIPEHEHVLEVLPGLVLERVLIAAAVGHSAVADLHLEGLVDEVVHLVAVLAGGAVDVRGVHLDPGPARGRSNRERLGKKEGEREFAGPAFWPKQT